MRTAIASRVLVLMALLLGWLVALAATVVALDTSPGEIFAHPDQFDQQTVTVRGSVTNLRQTTSQRGNHYYTFDLDDGRRSIRVFSFGHSPCRDGASTTVEGTFQRVKRMGPYTFYNQIDASRVDCH
jgi:hypothetical protein